MILKENSILNSLSRRGIEGRTLIYLDAITHTIRMIEIMFCNLGHLLANHDKQMENKNNQFHDRTMIDVWGIVDCLHRLRQILSSLSGIKKKAPWFQKFLRQLSEVENLRHFLQNYDREIPKMDENNSPIVGHLCWLVMHAPNMVEVILVQPGRIKTKSLRCINPLDKPIYCPIDHITFFLGEFSVDISDLMRGLKDFIQSLEKYLDILSLERSASQLAKKG